MITQQLRVHFADGTSEEVRATQWSLGQWGPYASGKGWGTNLEENPMLAISMLRFQAWAELHRTSKTRPSFEAWDLTVDEVEPVTGQVEADPTPPPTSGG